MGRSAFAVWRIIVACMVTGAVSQQSSGNPVAHWFQTFHGLLPATSASQDATGVVYSQGRWHVMPDCSGGYVPSGTLSWCHLSSTDLLHWTEHPPVLTPTDDPSIDHAYQTPSTRVQCPCCRTVPQPSCVLSPFSPLPRRPSLRHLRHRERQQRKHQLCITRLVPLASRDSISSRHRRSDAVLCAVPLLTTHMEGRAASISSISPLQRSPLQT